MDSGTRTQSHEPERAHARWMVLFLVPLIAAGCSAMKEMTKPAAPAAVVPVADTLVYCHDGTGHRPGAVPWILGGICCCNPTRAMFSVYQAEKTVPADMTFEAFLQRFADRGIKVGPEHAGCNNRCESGPHVVFGGKCMAAPTPGTENYEQVSLGRRSSTP